MSLEDIVSVSISLAAAGLSKPGFGTILCAGNAPSAVSTAWGPELVRTYTSAADMLATSEGFTISDRLYKLVVKIFSQNPKPRRVKVGRLTTAHTQTVNLTPTNTTVGFVYSGKIAGTEFSYTVATATVAAIVTGLKSAIDALSISGLTTTDNTTHLTCAATAGLTLDYTELSTAFGVADVTADPGTAADLTAITAQDNDWYMLCVDSSSEAINNAVAAWTEATYKIFAGHTADTAVHTSATTDVASDMQAASYFRSGIWFNQDISANVAPAILASRATAVPGSDTWALKNLSGVIPSDHLTATQVGYLKAKNVNYYRTVDVGRTFGGMVSGREYYDVVRFLDWLRATMQANVYNSLIAFERVPNTTEGISVIQGAVETTLKQGIKQGGFKPSSTSSTVPAEDDETAFDPVTRTLTGVEFSGVLANAIHAVEITGRVTN